MNKLTGLLITTDDVVKTVTFDDHHEDICRLLDANCFEVVSLPSFNCLVMLVDDEGLNLDKPLNRVASWFYGYELHGNPIAGDAILIWRNGPDLFSMDDFDLKCYKSNLIRDFGMKDGDQDAQR